MNNIYDKNNKTENYTTLSTYTPYLNTLATKNVKVLSCCPDKIKLGQPNNNPYNSLSMQNCSYMFPYATEKYINSKTVKCKIPDIYEGITVNL
jgi:hypothetical protein